MRSPCYSITCDYYAVNDPPFHKPLVRRSTARWYVPTRRPARGVCFSRIMAGRKGHRGHERKESIWSSIVRSSGCTLRGVDGKLFYQRGKMLDICMPAPSLPRNMYGRAAMHALEQPSTVPGMQYPEPPTGSPASSHMRMEQRAPRRAHFTGIHRCLPATRKTLCAARTAHSTQSNAFPARAASDCAECAIRASMLLLSKGRTATIRYSPMLGTSVLS